MKNLIKALSGAALTAVLGCFMTAAVSAQMIDLNKTGSITLKFTEDSGSPVTDGDFTIYEVAVLSQQGDSLVYTYSDDFCYCDEDLSGSLTQSLAEAIYEYAAENNVGGITKTLGSDGTAAFDGLPLGLYLVTQSKASTGYYAAVPFLAAVPYYDFDDDVWVYSVEASPKIELSAETTTESGGGGGSETTTEVTEETTEGTEATTTSSGGGGGGDEPDDDDDDDDDDEPKSGGGGGGDSYVIGRPDPEEYTPSSSDTPSYPSNHDDPADDDSDDADRADPDQPDQPDEPKDGAEPGDGEEPKEELPQTGQHNLPVPIMAVCGMCLFSLGWKLSFSDGRKKDAP